MTDHPRDAGRGSPSAEERAVQALANARAFLAGGDLAGAANSLGDAAERWSSIGNRAEVTRCLRLAASLTRHDRRPEAAVRLAREAVSAAPEADRAAAMVELGRAESAAGTDRSAVCAALADLESDGSAAQPVGPLVEAVALLTDLGRPDLADRLTARLADPAAGGMEPAADELGRHAVRSQLALLAAGRAVTDGDLSSAVGLAIRARTESLAGRAPTCYLAAAYALAALQETSGDDVAAYGTLASGWVTIADLLGGPVGQAAFAPALGALRDRLGTDRFGRVRAAYEKTRTAA